MQLVGALVADAQSSQVVQVRERALDDPALAAQAAAVLGAAPCDYRLHATRPQLPAVLVVVIAAVGEDTVGALTRPPGLPRDRADTIDQRQQLGDVVAVAAGQADRERDAGLSVIRWCFDPIRARSTGEGPVRAPLKSTNVAAIDDRR